VRVFSKTQYNPKPCLKLISISFINIFPVSLPQPVQYDVRLATGVLAADGSFLPFKEVVNDLGQHGVLVQVEQVGHLGFLVHVLAVLLGYGLGLLLGRA
jgi:hypothetical protein